MRSTSRSAASTSCSRCPFSEDRPRQGSLQVARARPAIVVLLAALIWPAPTQAKGARGSAPAAEPAQAAGRTPFLALAAPEVLAALGPFRPAPGAWVEYAVRSKARPDARARISILAPGLPGERYWVELASATASGLAAATGLLVHGDPARPGAIERLLVYVAGQPPFELPLDSVPPPPEAGPEGHARVTALPAARVRVPAGSFLTDRLRIVARGAATQVWRSSEVPLLGLGRSRGPGGEAELRGSSREGAHSVFPAGADTDSAAAPQVASPSSAAGRAR